MNPWINYHHLNYFRVIATEGSISKASEKLKIGQPTLSAQLKIFEDTIGVQLFERQHKKLKLTESGKLALDYANEIFKIGGELIEVLHDRLVPNRPHVQIGAIDGVPKQVVLAVAKAALKAGRCTVSFLEGSADELVRDLALHKIDLVISNYVPTSNIDLKIFSRSIAKFPISIYGGKKFKHLKKNFPQSLQNSPFVMPTKHSKIRHDLEIFLKEQNVSVDVIAETQDTALQKLMGGEELGLVPLSNFSASGLIKDQELFEIGKLPNVNEEIYFLSLSRKIENPISSQLMKFFKM